MANKRPLNIIDAVNQMVRASRQMMHRIHREPTDEELAQELAMPVEDVRKMWEIARTPIRFGT